LFLAELLDRNVLPFGIGFKQEQPGTLHAIINIPQRPSFDGIFAKSVFEKVILGFR
jgi:hypothetical protein